MEERTAAEELAARQGRKNRDNPDGTHASLQFDGVDGWESDEANSDEFGVDEREQELLDMTGINGDLEEDMPAQLRRDGKPMNMVDQMVDEVQISHTHAHRK